MNLNYDDLYLKTQASSLIGICVAQLEIHVNYWHHLEDALVIPQMKHKQLTY